MSGTDALACGYQRFTQQVAEIVMHAGRSCSNALKGAALRINAKIIQACVFWMKHATPFSCHFAPPGDGGLWTGPNAWISETLQRRVSDVSGWKFSNVSDLVRNIRQPQHPRRSKKKLKERVATLEISTQRNHFLGLLPFSACLGEARSAPVCPAYKWLYGFGFVGPQTGETYWLLMPSVSVEIMNLALAEFARDVNPDGKKQIILLSDYAGFHTPSHLSAEMSYFICPRQQNRISTCRTAPFLRDMNRICLSHQSAVGMDGFGFRAHPDMNARRARGPCGT